MAYFIIVVLSMMCEGAIASMLPTITIEIFGHKRGHQIYSFVYSNFGFQALASGLIVGTLSNYIGFHGIFMCCLGTTLIAAFLTFTLDPTKKFNYAKLVTQDKSIEKYHDTFVKL